MSSLENVPSLKHITIKPYTNTWVFPNTKNCIIVFAKGRLMNLGCATVHPSFLISRSLTNQVIAHLESMKKKVYVFPKHGSEKVVALPIGKLGAKITKLS